MAWLTFRLQFFLFNGTSREVLAGPFSLNVNRENFTPYVNTKANSPKETDNLCSIGSYRKPIHR
jgi:hypothetical protein